jgi:Tol biopolymer transport system component
MARGLEEWRETVNRAKVVSVRDRRAIIGISAMVVAALAAALVLGATVGSRDAEAAFPGANGDIVFQSNRAGTNVHVMDANAATNDVVNLTNSDGHSNPAYSPDGSRIAFVSGGPRGYDIFVMNADGSGRRQVTDTGPDATGRADSYPTWSPDGTQIAFVANNIGPGGDGSGDREIWMVNADGSERTLLTNNNSDDYYPAWSPLGNQIAYVNHTDRNIYVMDTDPETSDAFNLTPSSPPTCSSNCYQGDDEDPAWSPDGTKIAYVHGWAPDDNPNAGGGRPNIWTMTSTGGNRETLQDDEHTSGSQPAWSPDGTKIAFTGAVTGGSNNIYTMDADGTNATPIETNSANDNSPDWQPTFPTSTACDVFGTGGDNTLTGNPVVAEVICGFGGNDTITGQDGDILMGDAGNDKLSIVAGRGTLNGGLGNDTASFEGAATDIAASLISGFAQRVGTDPLEGVALVGIENLIGSDNDDVLTGSNGKNKLTGRLGDDDLSGLGKPDTLNSRDGIRKNDSVDGGSGSDDCVTDRGDIRQSCP